ncbi:MAG: hypothetical protein MJA84_17135 [Firmicutes bacterium]|nr:hypothetical protein [Bacillota bacterium]
MRTMMLSRTRYRCNNLLLAGLLAVALPLIGCEEEPPVRAYSVPAENRKANDELKMSPEMPPNRAEMPGATDTTTASGASGGPTVAPQGIAWTLPEGWKETASQSSFRLATFIAGSGESEAEIAVTRLGGSGGSLLSNVNRWRGQIGLDPAAESDLPDMVEEFKAGDTPGVVLDMTGKPAVAGEPPQRMLVAMLREEGGSSYFIKLTEPADIAALHRDSFMRFIESIRLQEGGT